MKNKTKTYILIAAVLCIWGIIGYQIMAAFESEKEPLNSGFQEVTFNPKTTLQIDTFSIKTVNRDPFLGTLLKKKLPVKTTIVNKKVLTAEFKWIPIVYHGMISDKWHSAQICIISINGKQHILKVGQEKDGVTLSSATSKSVTIVYKGKKKVISKT